MLSLMLFEWARGGEGVHKGNWNGAHVLAIGGGGGVIGVTMAGGAAGGAAGNRRSGSCECTLIRS